MVKMQNGYQPYKLKLNQMYVVMVWGQKDMYGILKCAIQKGQYVTVANKPDVWHWGVYAKDV